MSQTGLRYHVPRKCQGQTVEYAYAAYNGIVYQRITDAGDGTVKYSRSKMLIGDECDYWDTEPRNIRWKRISAEDIQAALDA